MLKLTAKANLEWYIRSIEKSLSLKCKIKSYPFSKYYRGHVISRCVPLTEKEFLSICAESKIYHGLIINEDFYIHPDTLLSYTKQYHRRKITKEIKKKVVSNPP